MIDQKVMRGETENGRFAAFALTVDGSRLFSEYGMAYIRQAAKLLFAESIAHDKSPEDMDKRIAEVIGVTVAKAARIRALLFLKKIAEEGGPQAMLKVFKEVMEGGCEE